MRISGGDARGVRLKVAPGTRPTSERVRQAIFSSIAAALPGARVLDLYCGSGAYGLEALSRGADSAVFVDANARALDAARSNSRVAGLEERCAFRKRDARAYIQTQAAREGEFDLVFVDPPYTARAGLPFDSLAPAVAPGGRVVVESGRTEGTAESQGWILEADRRYGDTRVRVYRRAT